MNALIDRHQADLFYSLQLLFDRLEVETWTPVGFEWFDEDYWRFGAQHFGRALAEQFLNVDARWSDALITYDTHHPERAIHGVTLAQARDMRWSYVVASVQDNQAGFARFAREHGAKYVYSVGNTSQQIDWDLNPLALVSAEAPIHGRGVRYHQEFDAKGLFGFRAPIPSAIVRVASFVNCFSSMSVYSNWQEARALAPDFIWREHGIAGADGNLEPVGVIADQMSIAQFAWHDKQQGDGFGHVIHNWAAVGRPLMGHASHYAGRLAGPLWDDLVTCIDLDRHPLPEAVALMREIAADPVRHGRMCAAIRARFDSLVDFDAEALAIKELLA